MLQYREKIIGPHEPFKPGRIYQIVLSIQSGHTHYVTRTYLEKILRAKYGKVDVLDWGREGKDWIVRIKVNSLKSTKSLVSPNDFNFWNNNNEGLIQPVSDYFTNSEGIVPAELPPLEDIQDLEAYIAGLLDEFGGGWFLDFLPELLPFLPGILTAAAVAIIFYFIWRVATTVKKTVELVPAPARAVAAVGAAAGFGGLGLAALGVIALAFFGSGKKKRRK